jgi:SAM-dependent methyltransferase
MSNKQNAPYTNIAPAYDYLLEHVDYQKWYEYIKSIMLKHNPDTRTVLEIGCGTGKFGPKFSADNYMITGMDISIPMLQIAKTRAFKNFTILCGDMTQFSFKKPFDFIFCVHDTVNYLLEETQIEHFFASVNKTMHKGSLFFFDITTPYNIKQNFDRKVNQYRKGDLFIEWSNSYKKKERRVYSTLEVLKNDGTSEVEQHIQKLYTIDEISKLLIKEGFEIISIFGDYTYKKPGRKTVMINFITRKV